MNAAQASQTAAHHRPGWIAWAAGAAAGYVCVRAALELYRLAPLSGSLLGKFSPKWGASYLFFVAGLALALGVLLASLLRPARLEPFAARLIRLRSRLGKLRKPAAVILALLPPLLLLYTPLGDLFSGAYLRLLILVFTSSSIGYLLTEGEVSPLRLPALLFGIALAGTAHLFLERLSNVSAYPFSLGWSEGNRLYDYSLIVDRGRYEIPDPSGLRLNAWGRNTLWGLPYLLPGATIQMLRLWDMLLWTVPYLALGWVIARRTQLSRWARFGLALWVTLFLFQGPVYTPLMLSALLVTWAVRLERPAGSALAAAFSGFYAAASRWTWLTAPAGWAGMLMLADFHVPQSEAALRTIKRLWPAALVTAAGLAGGILADDRLFHPAELKSSTSLTQPLLWYRLLPNVNYAEGLLLGLLIAVLPALALLTWAAWSRHWRLNWVQATAYSAAAAVFLIAGLVASVKIGGGNNLHNLDMFLVTLAILVGLALKGAEDASPGIETLPGWVRAALIATALLPAWHAARLGGPLALPEQAVVEQSLAQIQARVSRGQKRGEVLFVDQRQLITFNSIEGVRLVPEYEKKLMMDRAMAGNTGYFRQFYRDLADARFAMIVSEPLFDNVQSLEAAFQEENNAWVEWVARPILCFYAPVETFSEVRTQILVPRAEPQGCEIFLEKVEP